MTTMLERAARAAIEAEQDQWDLPAGEWDMKALEVHGALSIARAVLMAVREPDDEVYWVGQLAQEGYVSGPGDAGAAFTAMIDAILSEEK